MDEKSEKLLQIPIQDLIKLNLSPQELSVYLSLHALSINGQCVSTRAQIAQTAHVSIKTVTRTLKNLSLDNAYYKKPLIQVEHRLFSGGNLNTNLIKLYIPRKKKDIE